MRRLFQKLSSRARRALGTEQLRLDVSQLRSELDRRTTVLASELDRRTTVLASELDRLTTALEREVRPELRAAFKDLGGQVNYSALAPNNSASKISQHLLSAQYRELARHGGPLPSFEDVEFRAFSQNGEDGILLYIFSLLGMGTRRCIEICAGDGIECNTANLIINHGWQGLLLDGDESLVHRGRVFYANHGDSFCFPPRIVNAWVNRENVNQIVQENGFEGPIDLLSLDMDGVDYWVWDALDVVQPRVVVAEVQCIWGADRAVTVPYSAAFKTESIDGFGVYSGASIPAFIKLARRKGYRLVGVQRLGFNAFFVREGLGEETLPEVKADACVDRPFVEWARRRFLEKVKDLPWVEV